MAAVRAIAVELVCLRLPDCSPVTNACPISPVKNGSSPKFSSTRPHRCSRLRSRTGANILFMPSPSASEATTLETLETKVVLNEAASPIGDGNIVPLFVKPWRPDHDEMDKL